MRLEDKYIDNDNVAQRPKGGVSLSYIEGHRIIQNLNELFPDTWKFEIKQLRSLYEHQVTGKNEKSGWDVGYSCEGRLTVFHSRKVVSQRFEDVGFGQGTDYSSLAGAHESAGKEAVTDCLKRCAKNLGNYFGLALYDKNQEAILEASVAGYQKLMRNAQKYCSVDVRGKLEAMVNMYKTEIGQNDASMITSVQWKELLNRMWPVYWDSFVDGGTDGDQASK